MTEVEKTRTLPYKPFCTFWILYQVLELPFLKKLNICDHITAVPGATPAHGAQDSSQDPLGQLLSRTSCDDDTLYLHYPKE